MYQWFHSHYFTVAFSLVGGMGHFISLPKKYVGAHWSNDTHWSHDAHRSHDTHRLHDTHRSHDTHSRRCTVTAQSVLSATAAETAKLQSLQQLLQSGREKQMRPVTQ